MRRDILVAFAALSCVGLLASTSAAKADCQYWSDWAYDYNECTNENGGVARIRNIAGEDYGAKCLLVPAECSDSGQSSGAISVRGLDEACEDGANAEIEVVASKINGDTGEYEIEEFTMTHEEGGFCYPGPRPAGAPWNYVAVGCRIGYNCN